MIYWHIQMNQPWGRDGGKIDSSIMLKETSPVIGTGDWLDIQCDYFTGKNLNALKINDLIFVHEGHKPIAICRIKSDSFKNPLLKSKFHHEHYRHIEVIDWYIGEKKFPQPQGTLERLINKTSTWKFIDEFYNKSKTKIIMKNYIDILLYKKQVILQGPPGTGKTKTAKDIAVELLQLNNVKDLKDNEQFKLVQFHPSYSYEDFVRGILVKSNGTQIEYSTENRVLAKFAKTAQLNFEEYLKTKNSLTLEEWTINIAKDYLSNIKDEIKNKGANYYLNNSTAYISEIKEDSFNYNNDEWSGPGFNLTFEEFYKCCMDNRIEVRKMSTETSLSKLAHIGRMGVHLLDDFWAFQDTQPSFIEILKKELKNYIIIIDEINRANLPSVLGELIYALEYRGEIVESMYDIKGDNSLIIPPNLFIIGTMNTADRSVGHIDYAIKRRFAFVDVLPEIEPVHPLIKEDFIKISSLFIKNFNGTGVPKVIEKSDSLASDFRTEDIWIGHSYFICKKENSNDNEDDTIAKPILNMKLKYEIIPLLKEYIKDGILNETEQVKKLMDELISKDFTK